MKYALVIPAGGVGKRMGEDIPKQYLQLGGKTILERTLNAFSEVKPEVVLIAAHKSYHSEIEQYIKNVFDDINFELFEEGRTRFHSVYNCLHSSLLSDIHKVLIHDGVRPFVSKSVINNVLTELDNHKSVIPYIKPTDTVKKLDHEKNCEFVEKTLDRETIALVQTPQGFNKELLLEAYKYAEENQFKGTDDSSIIEYFDTTTRLIDGSYDNIKITTPFDMKIAELLIKENK